MWPRCGKFFIVDENAYDCVEKNIRIVKKLGKSHFPSLKCRKCWSLSASCVVLILQIHVTFVETSYLKTGKIHHSLNHFKVMQAEHSWLITWKLTPNLEHLFTTYVHLSDFTNTNKKVLPLVCHSVKVGVLVA